MINIRQSSTANLLSLTCLTLCIQFHLSSVHWEHRAVVPKGMGFHVCRVHFIFLVSDTHLATINEALIALLIIVIALLILEVTVSPQAFEQGILFHKRESFSRCAEFDPLPPCRIRSTRLGNKISLRLKLRLSTFSNFLII